MASITKNGKMWRVQIKQKGIRLSASFPTKNECQVWASEQEKDIRAQKLGMASNKTVGDVLDRYSKEISPTKKGELWEVKRIRVLLTYSVAKVRLSDLDSTHVARWRDERLQDVSGSSVCRDWNLLSHALEIARKEWRWIHANPFKNQVSRPKVSPPREKVFTDEEVEKICFCLGDKGVSGKVKDAFLFALETAMRCSEITGLQAESIKDRFVRVEESKNGSPRNVPLSQKARSILAKYPEGFCISSRQVDALFRKARNAAQVTGRFHDSRRTALSRLSKLFSVMELAKISGHKDINILYKHYYQVSVEDLAERMQSSE